MSTLIVEFTYCTGIYLPCRVFWSLMVLTSFVGSAAVVWTFTDRHIRIPIVVGVDRAYMQWNTTFPSITICAREKLNDTAFDRFIRR